MIFTLAIRRRLCGCIVAAATPGTAPARELMRVFGASRDYRVVPVAGRPAVVRCPHAGSPYFTPRCPPESSPEAPEYERNVT